MVKNYGGNRAKKQGRKFVQETNDTTKTRFSKDEDEIYACCTRIFGNGMCSVDCIDGKSRICIIRKKFKGRGKRGNVVNIGTWILVGRRSFEKVSDSSEKKEKCDLLEVYSNKDCSKIKQRETKYTSKLKEFDQIGGNKIEKSNNKDDTIEFEDESNHVNIDDYYEGLEMPPEYDSDNISEDEEIICENDI